MSWKILDLCGGLGGWSQPYADAGYTVEIVDIKSGGDAILWPSKTSDEPRVPRQFESVEEIGPVHGILAAPVCTVFSGSGALRKRSDDDIRQGLALVDACLRIVQATKPVWWAMENPVGKLRKWIGPPAYSFQPYEFGDPYTKRTLLWGNFNHPEKNPVEPTEGTDRIMKLGGKSERTKTLRSLTPPGFARAFFKANP